MVRSAFLATLVGGAICTAPALAQGPPTLPDHYALTNARIVVSPGRVIENGTVILRNGRIAAVGAQVPVPASAIRLDLSGRTVYPGLIDAATSFGLPTVTGQDAERGAEVMPGRSAADVWSPDAAALDAVRNGGVTTLGLIFDGGLFPGRIAAVNTGGPPGRSPVLRTPVAQQVSLGRRRGGYPGTLMGAIAFVKQGFHDAQYDARARQAFERNPSGPRPDHAPDSRALESAATGQLPVWFTASAERELNRIPDLAGDMGVRSFVVVGAREGWRAVDVLRRMNQPVIVSLDFPSVSQVTGRAFELNVAPPSGRNTAREEADSAVARQVRGNAAALAQAGVSFALSTHGAASPSVLRERARTAIEAGLPAEDALRALTVIPARLLGIENAVGTVEPGKLANLVVADGDLFAPDTRVRHVFVEGIRYDVPEARQQRTANAGAAAGARVAAAGQWVGELDGPTGLLQFSLTITGSGESLTGTMSSELGTTELRGSQSGDRVTLEGTFSVQGMNPVRLTVSGRITGDDLRGTFEAQGMAAVEFTARRRSPGSEEVDR